MTKKPESGNGYVDFPIHVTDVMGLILREHKHQTSRRVYSCKFWSTIHECFKLF